MSWTLEDAARVGDLLGGLATAIGLGFAIWSVNRWKVERRAAGRADAAANALAALVMFCDEVAGWTVAMRLAGHFASAEEAPDRAAEILEDWSKKHLAGVQARRLDLYAAEVKCIPHLTSEETLPIREAWAQYLQLHVAILSRQKSLKNLGESRATMLELLTADLDRISRQLTLVKSKGEETLSRIARHLPVSVGGRVVPHSPDLGDGSAG